MPYTDDPRWEKPTDHAYSSKGWATSDAGYLSMIKQVGSRGKVIKHRLGYDTTRLWTSQRPANVQREQDVLTCGGLLCRDKRMVGHREDLQSAAFVLQTGGVSVSEAQPNDAGT